MNGPQILEFTGFLILGSGMGLLYFLLLRHSVGLFVRQGAAIQALPLLLARGGLAVLLFWIAARTGLWPLLAAGAGFLLARSAVMLFVGRGP